MRALAVAICAVVLATGWTSARGHIGAPAWSRDGARIAWTEGVGPESRIWIATRDLKHAHAVSPAIDALGQIAWLPDGRVIYWADFRLLVLGPGGRSSLFANAPGGDFALNRRGTKVAMGDAPCSLGCYGPVLIFDLNSRRLRRVGGAKVQNMSPTFSPNGGRVAFERIFCERTGRCEKPAGIWTASIANGKLRRLTTGNQGCPSWSPDGRTIAYVDLTDVTDEPLGVVRIQDAKTTVLARGVGCNLSFPPQWSPDSRSVAFAGRATGQLMVVNVATHRARALTGIGLGAANGFAWSPDSSKLLVSTGPANCSSLWLVDAKTSAARKLRGC
jgi:Tol biopolymer transport system component